ncbi:uncharacterized protein LOC120195035 [Hibiscus syriacus]|uniref:uncharacterized protein LOC120195035 n=1 Tax=Hibiscus syriacus TaxID=106335 RepID=UPI0019224F21|nr:uncharacterized protein LOC120195035 [Hibiscus syriacus]
MEQIAAIGIVVRDHNGLVTGGICKQIKQPFTAESTEVEAFTQRIKFTVENGWTNATIEGDAISIVNMLVNNKEDASTIDLLLTDTRLMLNANKDLKVFYVNRDANWAAHTLAHWVFCPNPVFYSLSLSLLHVRSIANLFISYVH